jgi:hypothetical protein
MIEEATTGHIVVPWSILSCAVDPASEPFS